MAGIGFQLRRLMAEQTFIGDIRAYTFAGIISAGPWIISILCLAFLWAFSYPDMGIELQKLFRVTVVYTFAYSLITTGPVQLVVTRFLADRLFLKQKTIMMPTYVALMMLTILVQGLTASVFYALSDVSLGFKISGVMLYIAVSCIWQSMVFLSVSRDYMAIVWTFFLGAVASFGGAIFLGRQYGFEGHLYGFTIGQVLVVFMLMYRIVYEFNSPITCRFDFLRQFPKYPKLIWVGVFYYAAIWADKIIYWYAPTGEHIQAYFYSHYPYDSCMFLAFLTIIPALAHFMVDVETNFYEAYKSFYGAIANKGSFQTIMAKKKEMVQVLYDSTSRMFVMQTAVTTLFILLAPHLIKFLSLREEHLWTVWAAGIGTYFHAFLLVTIIIILYFDRLMDTLWVGLFFLLTNSVGTWMVMRFWPEYMGAGYAASTFLSTCFAIGILAKNVRHIEYLTFTEQPISKPSLPKEIPTTDARP